MAETIFDTLCQKFDHIFMLTLSHRKDRHNFMESQLNYYGYTGVDLEQIKKFTTVYTTTWPYNKVIMDALNTSANRICLRRPNEYDCTRNHYNIIKTAYDLGYERILIMEDDICFLKPELLKEALSHMPDDYDLLQLSGFTTNSYALRFQELREKGEMFTKVPNSFGLWCTALYALNREGMKWYMSFIETRMSVADMPLYVHPENTYVATLPWAIQQDKAENPSDIRDAGNDDIDYNNMNTYESGIRKYDYYGYKVPDQANEPA